MRAVGNRLEGEANVGGGSDDSYYCSESSGPFVFVVPPQSVES